MREVLTVEAERAGRESGFVQRAGKLNGGSFTQTLTFGWLAKPEATQEELRQTAASLGVEISPQGLDQRFTPAAAEWVKRVLERAVGRVRARGPRSIPLLERFAGVYLLDSTTIMLPDALAEEWSGVGGRTSAGRAAVKIRIRLEVSPGVLHGPLLQAGRVQDSSCRLQMAPLPRPGLLGLTSAAGDRSAARLLALARPGA